MKQMHQADDIKFQKLLKQTQAGNMNVMNHDFLNFKVLTDINHVNLKKNVIIMK